MIRPLERPDETQPARSGRQMGDSAWRLERPEKTLHPAGWGPSNDIALEPIWASEEQRDSV